MLHSTNSDLILFCPCSVIAILKRHYKETPNIYYTTSWRHFIANIGWDRQSDRLLICTHTYILEQVILQNHMLKGSENWKHNVMWWFFFSKCIYGFIHLKITQRMNARRRRPIVRRQLLTNIHPSALSSIYPDSN